MKMTAACLLGDDLKPSTRKRAGIPERLERSESEILRITEKVNFQCSRPFQQEAIARALGKKAVPKLSRMAESYHEALKNGKGLSQFTEEQYKRTNSDEVQPRCLGTKLTDTWASIFYN